MREIPKHLRADRNRARGAHQIPGSIERMNANVDKRTTARTFLVGKPQANSSGNSARPNPAGARAINFAQAPFGDDVPGGADSGGKSKLPSKKINQSPSFRFIAQHFHFRGVHRRRFLAKDVLTRS